MTDAMNKTSEYAEKAREIELLYSDFLKKLQALKLEQDKVIINFVESIKLQKIEELKLNLLSKEQ